MLHLLSLLQGEVFPFDGYVPLTPGPGQWFTHLILPWITLSVLFIGFYSRVLRSTILDTIDRGLRPHGTRQGPFRAAGPHQARPAQQSDPDHLALGPRHRPGDRRRCDLRRSDCDLNGVGELGAQRDRAAGRHRDDGRRDVGRVRRRVRRRHGRHRLRRLGSADPARLMSSPPRHRCWRWSTLHVSFTTEGGGVQGHKRGLVQVGPCKVVAIVGESGSGKSVTAMTVLGLTRGSNARFEGPRHARGHGASPRLRRRTCRGVRGAEIAMVFQDPMSALDPVSRIGARSSSDPRARASSRGRRHPTALRAARAGRDPAARERVRSYPHEFSGGMRQRVMIAMALSCSPSC